MISIEFIGPPGSGKTSLVNYLSNNNLQYIKFSDAYIKSFEKTFESCEISDSLNRYNNSLKNFIKILYYLMPGSKKKYAVYSISRLFGLQREMIVQFSCSQPYYFKNVFKIIKYYTNDSNKKYMVRAFEGVLLTIEKYMLIRNCDVKKILLIDEGLVKGIQSIQSPPYYFEKALKKHISIYLQNIPHPQMIVYLYAEPETCLFRMKNRKNGFPEGYKELTNEGRLKKIKLEINSCESILEVFKDMNVPVVKIDAESDLSIQSEIAHNKIQLTL